MEPADVVSAMGGVARHGDLAALFSPRKLRAELESGRLLRTGRGVYSLPDSDSGLMLATRLRGVLSHTSAARHWGFALVREPDAEHVTVPAHAHRRMDRAGVRLHYRALQPYDVRDHVTTPARTVLDCARDLPLTEALAVGDSALGSGKVTARQLARHLGLLTGAGCGLARERIRLMHPGAANGFESAARAILIAGGVTGFVPQLEIRQGGRLLGRVDLGHPGLRIVIECDSFQHHGHRSALAYDCRRYSELAAAGWIVLRFAWEHVMFEPEWVLATVKAAIERLTRPEGAEHGAVSALLGAS